MKENMLSTSEHIKSRPGFPTSRLGPIQKGPRRTMTVFSITASQGLLCHTQYIAYYLSSCFSTLCLVRVYLWDNCRLKGKWANIANYAWIFSELDRPNEIFVNTWWDHHIGLNMVCLQPMVHVGLIIPCSNIHSWSCLCVFKKTYFEYVLPKINNNTKDAISGQKILI